MKKQQLKPYWILGGVFLALLSVIFLCYFFLPGYHAPDFSVLMVLCVLLLIPLMIALCAIRLTQSLKESLYAYKNIVLIGAMLVLLVTLGVGLYFALRSGDHSFASMFDLLVVFPRQFSLYILPLLFVICLLIFISNLSLIRHEGFRVTNLLGAVLGVLFIGSTVFLYWISDLIGEQLSTHMAPHAWPIIVNTFASLFLLMIICYFECLFLGSIIMGYVTARHIPHYDKDYIIILGCSISKKGGLLPLVKGRTNRAIRFAWDQEIATGRKVLYVPSGGQGPNEILSEGSAMGLYLLSHGAEENEVFPEKESRNTYENLVFSKKIIDQLKPGATFAFATTNYHVLRSGLLARTAGFDIEGIASGTKWYFWPNGFVREFFGILSIKKKHHLLVILLCFLLCLLGALITGNIL